MQKKRVLAVMMGAAVMCGSALAQADGPQEQSPREGDRPHCRPADAGRGRPEQPGPENQDFRPAGRPEGRDRSRMRQGGNEGSLPDPKRLKEAGATEEQLAALKKIVEEQQFKRIDLKAAAEKAEWALDIQMKSDSADEKTVLKAVDELCQARAELFKLEIGSKLKVREILGSAVMKKLHEMGPKDRAGGPARAAGEMRKGMPSAGERPPAPDQK